MRSLASTVLVVAGLALAGCGGSAPTEATRPALAPPPPPAASAPGTLPAPPASGAPVDPPATPVPSVAAHAFGAAYGKLGRRANRLRTTLSEDAVRGDVGAVRRDLQRLRLVLVGYQRALRATAFPPAVVPHVVGLRRSNRTTILALGALARSPGATVLGRRTDAVLADGFPPLVDASQRIAEALSGPAGAASPGG